MNVAPLPNLLPPPWCDGFGEDDLGLFAEFHVLEVRFRLRWIAPGAFMMGDEQDGPPHRVSLTRGFWMGEGPVTQEQWKAVTGDNPSHFEGARRPVERVSWEESRRFSEQLNELIPTLDATLPTEAQWEYACRAGTTTRFNNGRGDDKALSEVGWFDANSKRNTHDVGQKKANKWGLYDMHGNVWEWCLDGRRNYTGEAVADPVGPLQQGAGRVIRGGGWCDPARACRSAFRSAGEPGLRFRILGFRLVAGQEQGEPEAK